MSVILEKFLVKNNYINFNRKDISLQLQTHPQYPSFRAITDTLDYFGIENVAATVPEDSLPSMPNSFVTLIDRNGPNLVLAIKKNGFIYTYFEDGEREKHSFSNFSKIWSKEIIAIEDNTRTGAQGLWLKLLAGFSMALVLVTFLSLREVSWNASIVIFLSAIGLYLSFLLVKEKIGYHSATVHSICTSIGKSNCDEVINSKGGMLTKNISLADASFLHFSILVFQNVFFGYNDVSSLFILFSIPVILFSIYYQAFVLKKWCLLCLGVATILVLLNISVFGGFSIGLSALQIMEFLMTMIVLIPAYFIIKKLLVNQKRNEEKLFAAGLFKRNPDIIKNLMREVKVVEDLGMMPNEIRIGNPEAAHKIIAFTNPFCGFCKAAFESYVKIIKAHPDVEVWVRFNSEYENFQSASTKITVRLVELHVEKGQEYFIDAFLDWFEDKDDKGWLKKYGSPEFEPETISILKAHINWARRNAITYTPATIIGGQEFPSFYGYEDLTLVLSDILEFEENA